MHVCDNKDLMPGRFRIAHHFWKAVACLLPIVGIVLLFFLPWWIGIILILLGIILMPAVQRSAAQFVLQRALEDADFFEAMQETRILRVSEGTT